MNSTTTVVKINTIDTTFTTVPNNPSMTLIKDQLIISSREGDESAKVKGCDD